MAHNVEQLVSALWKEIRREPDDGQFHRAPLAIPRDDAVLLLNHIEWLQREFKLVQEMKNEAHLEHSLYLNNLADLCNLPMIPPDEGPEWLVENRIKAIRRENAVLKSELNAQKEK